MIDVKDRIPAEGMANRKKLTFADGSIQYAVIEAADSPVVGGTAINRNLFNDLQGFAPSTITFGTDGTITETDPNTGVVKTVSFGEDGTIVESRNANGSILTKTITFAADGSIIQTIG